MTSERRTDGPKAVQRILVIRALVLGSIALLISGAVTPLLTTERFYFFSNTFSFASGLRQLVANGEFLIAALVGLFSICVPAVKAIVIWLASSERAPRGPLLLVADRFGKWSMLEVFIAALLIIAIKLGPVVDATLHYGAYLLAASVLLSGLASQLLVHEPHARPTFSRPVTLTIGGIVGAFAATLLIGLLNPELLSLEAVVGTPQTRCVQRVLRLDRIYADISGSQSEYTAYLRDIQTEGCPDEFRDAFASYVEAWARLEADGADARNEQRLLDRVSIWLGLIATREDALEDIDEAWERLERLALRNGVTAPTK